VRVLITGATGFLGKKVLESILSDERIQAVSVISRQVRVHPNPRVSVYTLDLSEPSCVDALSTLVHQHDSVIHLAGLYRFTQSYSENYQQNVLPALNLVAAYKQCSEQYNIPAIDLPPLFYASTFAVGLGLKSALLEEPLTQLSPQKYSYSYTKGLAERVFSDSPYRTYIFRLASLTGRMQDGLIEKIDGPYIFLNILRMASRIPGSKHIPFFPVLADPLGHLPITPVDCAAELFHSALFNTALLAQYKVHLCAVDLDTVKIKDYCEHSIKRYFKSARPVYVKKIPTALSSLEKKLTAGVKEIFEFSLNPIHCHNDQFKRYFPKIIIPRFEQFESQFYYGFEQYQGEIQTQ
jgi:nucleoside-diphosphate-sugar epimerase